MTDTAISATLPDEHPGWMRDATFDRSFILGTALVALLSGFIVVMAPSLWPLVLGADLWLLGGHHVIATSTRLVFDRESYERHRFLVLYLPPLVLAGTAAVFFGLGAWAVTSVYFYWQWFHYTRQSYGIERIYARKAGFGGQPTDRLTKAMIYGVPLWGVLHRSAQGQDHFLGNDTWWIPVPEVLANAVGAAAVGGMVVWAWRQVRTPVSKAHTLYVASHLVVFLIGYVLVADVTFGWLVINVWHNFQYILVVWAYNAGRFKEGVDAKAKFLSYLSQPRRIVQYMAVMLGISTVAYLLIGGLADALSTESLQVGLILYMTINFHHYIVDSVIWKMRKPVNQERLGVAGAPPS